MPMWSFTATRSFCLQPRYFGRLSAYVSEEELDLLQFAASQVAKTRACAPDREAQGCPTALSKQNL
jgi:hypothetical protein